MAINDQDVLHETGRGGVGNFHPIKSDAVNANKSFDRQHHGPIVTIQGFPSSTTRAGRGGAGNFIDPLYVPNAGDRGQTAGNVVTAMTTTQKKHMHQGGSSGRGGAGNWVRWRRRHGDDSKMKSELDRAVQREVQRELKIPERTHCGREKRL